VFKRLSAALRAILTGKHGTPQAPTACSDEPRCVEERARPAVGHGGASREKVAVHAYHRWLSRGKPIGTDWEDWFEAERQLGPMAGG